MSNEVKASGEMFNEQKMTDLAKLATKKCNEPMNTWPAHNDYHRRNTHPFSGSRHGELYFDEQCLRCQLERIAAEGGEAK